MTDIIEIANDHWQVGFAPAVGGSIAYGRTRVGSAWVDLLRDSGEGGPDRWGASASYPLVPWSNRIRTGRLNWAGRSYQLRVNFPDGTAIHGTGVEYPWTVVDQGAEHVTLELGSRNFYGVNWPWSFVARFEYRLDGPRFECIMSVRNADHETFAAGLGHHPYFQRVLEADGAALSEGAQLQVNFERGYDLVDCMPTAAAGDLRADADFRVARPLGTAFVDDCYTGRTSATAATITYPGALRVDMEADDMCSHLVVYIPQDKTFFAVEPVTNANDAFNLDEAGIATTGLFLVQPDETRSAAWSLVATEL
jgi:aldose 1-epimerase